ncbi:MAG: hypothetical protein ACRDRP_04565 [Pseudonocardiaceae bacterium]
MTDHHSSFEDELDSADAPGYLRQEAPQADQRDEQAAAAQRHGAAADARQARDDWGAELAAQEALGCYLDGLTPQQREAEDEIAGAWARANPEALGTVDDTQPATLDDEEPAVHQVTNDERPSNEMVVEAYKLDARIDQLDAQVEGLRQDLGEGHVRAADEHDVALMIEWTQEQLALAKGATVEDVDDAWGSSREDQLAATNDPAGTAAAPVAHPNYYRSDGSFDQVAYWTGQAHSDDPVTVAAAQRALTSIRIGRESAAADQLTSTDAAHDAQGSSQEDERATAGDPAAELDPSPQTSAASKGPLRAQVAARVREEAWAPAYVADAGDPVEAKTRQWLADEAAKTQWWLAGNLPQHPEQRTPDGRGCLIPDTPTHVSAGTLMAEAAAIAASEAVWDDGDWDDHDRRPLEEVVAEARAAVQELANREPAHEPAPAQAYEQPAAVTADAVVSGDD